MSAAVHSHNPSDFHAMAESQALRVMVDRQVRTFDVTDLLVLAAFETVPRLPFVAPEFTSIAYSDKALPARTAPNTPSRTMLAPMVLARLLQAANIEKGTRCLDVAGGAGYGAAVLAKMGANVTMLESAPEQVALVREIFASPGLSNLALAPISFTNGALSQGYAGNAPYDVILIEGAVESGLESLFDQLAEGGRLLAIQNQGAQKAVSYEKFAGTITKRILFAAGASLLPDFAEKPTFHFT